MLSSYIGEFQIFHLAHENMINILGGHGIGINIHGFQPNPRNDHACTKIKSLSGTVNVKWKILVFGFSFKQKGNYDKFLLISE